MRLLQTVATTPEENETFICFRNTVAMLSTRCKDRQKHSGFSSIAMALPPHSIAAIAVLHVIAKESETEPSKGQYCDISICNRDVLTYVTLMGSLSLLEAVSSQEQGRRQNQRYV